MKITQVIEPAQYTDWLFDNALLQLGKLQHGEQAMRILAGHVRYVVLLDNQRIVKLDTVTLSGQCRFDKLPMPL